MPANQHAFVFLKDVRHDTLKDLVQFMYTGEVNVKHDTFPTFISTAESLQIKGLTEIVDSVPSQTLVANLPRPRQLNIKRTPRDSSGDTPTPVVKRTKSRGNTPVTVPALKRRKDNDPREVSEPTSQQQIIIIETESNADKPFTKAFSSNSEMDYGSDTDELEAVKDDMIYIEDDDSGGYDDTKCETSYFTENDDVGASGFVEERHAGEAEIQSVFDAPNHAYYVKGFRGCRKLKCGMYSFTRNKIKKDRTYWSCARAGIHKCKARMVTITNGKGQSAVIKNNVHNHEPF